MAKIPPTQTWSIDTTFKYVGGDPGLDLVNTVDWTRRGLEEDRLPDFASLTRWAEGAGVISAREGTRLRRQGGAHPRRAERALGSARRLRWVLSRVFGSVAAGAHEPAAWQELNSALAEALTHLRLDAPPGGEMAEWTWDGREGDLGWFLWPVIRQAADLLASEEATRIRMCDGKDCGWVYVDRSRNGLRRWCDMATCGTREKTRRRRKGSRAE
ncbi:MAG TPA: ABATE domain-containing protein [Gemmatimonadales bacterium]|nr:ABATE domain-containing protein [Gemmatimonadales bacterium]